MKIFWILLLINSFSFSNEIEWLDEYDQAKKEALKTNKPIMLMYSSEDCGMCNFMKKSVFSQDQVASFIESSYIPLMIDVDLEGTLEGHKLYGTPTFYFLNAKGKKVGRIVGGAKATPFLEELKKIKKRASLIR